MIDYKNLRLRQNVTIHQLSELSGISFKKIAAVEKHKDHFSSEEYCIHNILLPSSQDNFEPDKAQDDDFDYSNINAYTDGSFDSILKVYGWGIVLLDQLGRKKTFSGSGSDEMASMWNVAGELTAAQKAIEIASAKKCKSLRIHYDYEGISKWPSRQWEAKNKFTQYYVELCDKVSFKLDFVHVKGHSGDKYNDEADHLAGVANGTQKESPDRTANNITSLSRCDIINLVDQWTAMDDIELLSGMPPEVQDIFINKGLSVKMAGNAVRWIKRGIPVEQAIGKVLN